jgi:hypothetical protein
MDIAFTLQQQAIDEFESGSFAGAAAAQEHQSFAALDFETQVAQKLVAGFEAIGNILELNGGAIVGSVYHSLLRTVLTANSMAML